MDARSGVVGRWLDWWESGDVAIADAIYAEGYQRHSVDSDDPGLDALKGLVAAYLRAFPDLHFEIDETVRQDDRIAVLWTATATDRGALMGMPPSGRRISLPGCDVLRIHDERITESWSFYDRMALLAQVKD
jgi:steroid delta-isomerase-like uncharacterized protein